MNAATPDLDPAIWGPHFWFFLHTIAFGYPMHPNDITKRKYYDFIQNLPVFIPNATAAKQWEEWLVLYPVTPFLDDREGFVRWCHHIHNKVNEQLQKPVLTLEEFHREYHRRYERRPPLVYPMVIDREKWTYFGLLALGLGIIWHQT